MEELLVLYELIILLYFIFSNIESGILRATSILLTLLLYISIKMLFYIYDSKKIRKLVIVIAMLCCGIASTYINKSFILFMPINIYILTGLIYKKIKLSFFIPYAFIVFVDKEMLWVYILIVNISYLFFYVIFHEGEKLHKLRKDNEILKEKNFSLHDKLRKESEYEKQVKYVYSLEERNKIAQEIHDNIGHTISGSLMQLEAAKLLISKDSDKSEKIIGNVIEILREGMENIRYTLRNIKPSYEQIGINRLKLICEEFEKNHNREVSLLYGDKMDKISHIQWRVIIENVNESLTNILKYSNCASIKVNIETLNRIIKVEVKDNGSGCNNIIKGLGIIGMEERAASIGGQVIVDGSQGFSVITLFPL